MIRSMRFDRIFDPPQPDSSYHADRFAAHVSDRYTSIPAILGRILQFRYLLTFPAHLRLILTFLCYTLFVCKKFIYG
jgi:hypothetical protein